MKRMCHSSRDYLPDLCCSEVGLDIDACHVEGFAVYSCEGDHIRMLASLRPVHANSAVYNELPPRDRRSLRGRREFDKTGRHFFDEGLRRRRFEAHHGYVVCTPIGRQAAEYSHSSGPVSSATAFPFAKSTRTSKRSAGEIVSWVAATGAGRKPPSDAMT